MTNMKSSICVYGPRGCGKTTNGERMMKAFGLDYVIDDADEIFIRSPSERKIPDVGALLLCERPPRVIPVPMMAYDEAMCAVKNYEKSTCE